MAGSWPPVLVAEWAVPTPSVCVAIDVSTSTYMYGCFCYRMCQRERHAPWTNMKQTIALCDYPQYSAHDKHMIWWIWSLPGNLTSTTEYIVYDYIFHATTKPLIKWYGAFQYKAPFWTHASTYYRKKRIKRRCTVIVHMLSYDTFHSLFAKPVHALIIQQHRDLHPNDSLNEYNPSIFDALEPPW